MDEQLGREFQATGITNRLPTNRLPYMEDGAWQMGDYGTRCIGGGCTRRLCTETEVVPHMAATPWWLCLDLHLADHVRARGETDSVGPLLLARACMHERALPRDEGQPPTRPATVLVARTLR